MHASAKDSERTSERRREAGRNSGDERYKNRERTSQRKKEMELMINFFSLPKFTFLYINLGFRV